MKQIDEYAIEYVNGNKEHESELFKMTYNLAKKVSWKQTFNEEDAEDIAQDTTIKAIEKLPTLESIETYEGWVVRIAQNKSKDFLKSAYYNKEKSTNYIVEDDEGNEVSWEDDTEDESIAYRPEVQLDNQTRDKLVQDIINDLPEKQKIVAIMHFYDGMTLREIAEDLGIPMSSVMGQFQTAKKNIKASVTEIQKRDDLKLYNISAIPAIPFFMYLLGNFESEYPTTGVASIVAETKTAEQVSKQSLESHTKQNIENKATEHTVKETGNTFAKTSVKAGASSAVKLGISVAVGIGIIGGGYVVYSHFAKSDNVNVTLSTNEEVENTTTTETSTPDTTSEEKIFTDGVFSFELPDGWTADSVYWDTSTNTYLDTDNGASTSIPVIRVYQNEYDVNKPHFLINTYETFYEDSANSNVSMDIASGYLSADDVYVTYGDTEYLNLTGTVYGAKLEYNTTQLEDTAELLDTMKSYCLAGENSFNYGEICIDLYNAYDGEDINILALDKILSTFKLNEIGQVSVSSDSGIIYRHYNNGEQVNNPSGTGDYKAFEVKKENGTTKYRIGEYTWVYDSDANCEYTEY